MSVYTPDEARKALEYDMLEVIQVPYNVFDHRLDQCGFFAEAKAKGVVVYARSTLLQGLLLMDAESLPGKVQFAQGYLKRFLRICNRYGQPPLRAAVGYVKKHMGIDYIVFGVDSLAQLKEYRAVMAEGIPDEMAEEFQKEFETVEERLVNPARWKP